jgi:hypothetical protein
MKPLKSIVRSFGHLNMQLSKVEQFVLQIGKFEKE